MSQNKTIPNKLSVKTFVDAIEDPQGRKDCRALMKTMSRLTGNRAKMWGANGAPMVR